MPYFSKKSLKILDTCHEDLNLLFKEVVKKFDCTIISGFRDEEEQNNLFAGGFSKLKFPHSNHNKFPSRGVDVVPYFSQKPHIRWEDLQSFCLFAGFVLGTASQKGIHIRWGGNFNMSDDIHSNNFIDMPHFELF